MLTLSSSLVSIAKYARAVCRALSGEEDDKECHYEAVLHPVRRVKKPIAVLEGRPLVSQITGMTDGAERPIGSEDTWINAPSFVSDGGAYRWKRFDDGVFLTFEMDREFYAPAINLASCTQRPVDLFTRVSCQDGQAQLLYEGPRAIVYSFAEYGEAAAQPLYRFRLDDK